MTESRRALPRPARHAVNVSFQDGSDDEGPPPLRSGRGGRGLGRGRASPLLGGGSGAYPSIGAGATPSAPSRRRNIYESQVAPVDESEVAAALPAARLPPPPPPPTRNPLGMPLPAPPRSRAGPPPLRPPRSRAAFEDGPPPLPPPSLCGAAGSSSSSSTLDPSAAHSGAMPSTGVTEVRRTAAGSDADRSPGGLGVSGLASASPAFRKEGVPAAASTAPPLGQQPAVGSGSSPTPGVVSSTSAFTPGGLGSSIAGAEEEVGFWGRLAQGARSTFGLVSDLVQAINADTESEEEENADRPASSKAQPPGTDASHVVAGANEQAAASVSRAGMPSPNFPGSHGLKGKATGNQDEVQGSSSDAWLDRRKGVPDEAATSVSRAGMPSPNFPGSHGLKGKGKGNQDEVKGSSGDAWLDRRKDGPDEATTLGGKGRGNQDEVKGSSDDAWLDRRKGVLDEDAYIEYLTQFCIYLGLDLATEPELIPEVDSFLKKPLPDQWSLHQTDESCEYGAGYTYYMNAATGRTQWTRPDEEALMATLCQKMKFPPLAGSRLFFARLRGKTQQARVAAIEERVGHLPDMRPLLRALPAGATEPTLGSVADGGVIHVALREQFPILHAAALEAFSAYFGLGALMRFGAAELRQLWIMKVAALCPVPEGWEFRFDEATLAAAFVETALGTVSTRHPLDGFFAGLLERMLLRHRSFEAMESQRAGKAISVGDQVAFFTDAKQGLPYWLRFDKFGPIRGYVSAPVPTQAPPLGGIRPASRGSSPAPPGSSPAPPAPVRRALAPPQEAESGLPSVEMPAYGTSLVERSAPRLAAQGANGTRHIPPTQSLLAVDDLSEGPRDDSDNDSAVSFGTLTTVTAVTGCTELSARAAAATETMAALAAFSASEGQKPPADFTSGPSRDAPRTVLAPAPPLPPTRRVPPPPPKTEPSIRLPARRSPSPPVQARPSSPLPPLPSLHAPCVPPASSELQEAATAKTVDEPQPVYSEPSDEIRENINREEPSVPSVRAPHSPTMDSDQSALRETAATDASAAPQQPVATVHSDEIRDTVKRKVVNAEVDAILDELESAGLRASPAQSPPHAMQAISPQKQEAPASSPVEHHTAPSQEDGMAQLAPSPLQGAENGLRAAPCEPEAAAAEALLIQQQAPPIPEDVTDADWDAAASNGEVVNECDAPIVQEAADTQLAAPPPPPATLPVLPISEKPSPPVGASHWAVQDGKWQMVSTKQVDEAARPVGNTSAPNPQSTHPGGSATLFALADRLRATHPEDIGAITTVLEALLVLPVTVQQLRETQLGILTKPYRDHSDKRLRAAAAKLRRNWKRVVQIEAEEGTGGQDYEDAEIAAGDAPRLHPETQHGMAPPSPVPGGMPFGAMGFQVDSRPPAAPPVGAALPQRPALRGRTVSPAVKKKRAELAANLQWLCRLYLETREQIFALHEGAPTEDVVCTGLREELDVVRFKRVLDEALNIPKGGAPTRRLIRALRAIGRRVLHERRCKAYGHQVHQRFVACCTGHGDSHSFVNGAVPRVLQLITRIIEEDRRARDAGAEIPGIDASDETCHEAHDPWVDSAGEDDAGDPNVAEESPNINEPEEDIDAPSNDIARPSPLHLPRGERCASSAEEPEDGSVTPRGQRNAQRKDAALQEANKSEAPFQFADPKASESFWEDGPKRVPAHPPYLCGEKALLAKVAKSPLPNLDGLVDALVPGAEITTDGLLLQLSDDELISFAYALEQVAEAASKRLVKEMENRDELRSTCLHRREYLQLLDGALSYDS